MHSNVSWYIRELLQSHLSTIVACSIKREEALGVYIVVSKIIKADLKTRTQRCILTLTFFDFLVFFLALCNTVNVTELAIETSSGAESDIILVLYVLVVCRDRVGDALSNDILRMGQVRSPNDGT